MAISLDLPTVTVFELSSETWNYTEQILLQSLGFVEADLCGYYPDSLALSNNTLMIGCPGTDSAFTSVISTSGVCYYGADWYDADGPEYNCDYYASNGCPDFGDNYANFGLNAQTACCDCMADPPDGYSTISSSVPAVGSVIVITKPDGDTWSSASMIILTDVDSAANDNYGHAVAIAGDTMVAQP